MAWDTGLPGFVWWSPWGYSKGGIHARVGFRYEKQLEALGLKPRDVRYVGFSHLHFDHTGNAGKFPEATWIVSEKEGAWALQEETPPGVYARSLRLLPKVKRRNAVDDLDVFGDGSVKLVSAPGHTPDHFSLLVNLKNSGPLLLVGDLYHLEESREKKLMPIYNTDREETLRSMERIESAAKTLKAKVVIGHDPKQFDSMPAFPGYLD